MDPEENASAAEQAMGNAGAAAETAGETVTTDEIKAVPMDTPAEKSDDGGFDEPFEQKAESPAEEQPARQERPRRTLPPVKPASQESMEEARSVLAHMFDFLGIDANIRVENKPRSVNLFVSTEEPGRVIGHHGKTLENLQLIVNRIMQKTDSEFPKLYIDMEGGRDRHTDRTERDRAERPERTEHRMERGERPRSREFRDRGDRRDRFGGSRRSSFSRDEILRQQALDAAKEVHQWGAPKTLPPMNSHDRRIVHITLESDAALTTNSIGDGENRSVVIALKEEVNV